MKNTSSNCELDVLVVGLGSIGLRHLENLKHLGCRRLGVYRSRNSPLHRFVDLQDVTIHLDYEQALAENYDAVVIANPTSLHMQYAQKAAQAGCHLYIEKPLSNNLEHVEALRSTVCRRNLVVMIGCQFRFHPNLMAIWDWLNKASIGRVLGVDVDVGEYLPGWHPWEDHRSGYAARDDLGGGVILTLIHEIDYLHWIFGPLEVLAAAGGNSGSLGIEVEDYVSSMLLAENGMPILLHMDYLQRPSCRKMKIVGSHGVIEWDYYKRKSTLTVGNEIASRSVLPRDWERNSLFLSIMSGFLEAIRSGGKSQIPLEEGIETLRSALEIKNCLALARSPTIRAL